MPKHYLFKKQKKYDKIDRDELSTLDDSDKILENERCRHAQIINYNNKARTGNSLEQLIIRLRLQNKQTFFLYLQSPALNLDMEAWLVEQE